MLCCQISLVDLRCFCLSVYFPICPDSVSVLASVYPCASLSLCLSLFLCQQVRSQLVGWLVVFFLSGCLSVYNYRPILLHLCKYFYCLSQYRFVNLYLLMYLSPDFMSASSSPFLSVSCSPFSRAIAYRRPLEGIWP